MLPDVRQRLLAHVASVDRQIRARGHITVGANSHVMDRRRATTGAVIEGPQVRRIRIMLPQDALIVGCTLGGEEQPPGQSLLPATNVLQQGFVFVGSDIAGEGLTAARRNEEIKIGVTQFLLMVYT
jgi:hypothetical protein